MPRPALLAALGLATALAAARGDVVELEGGGRLEGRLVRDAEVERGNLAVDSRYGRVVVDRDFVLRTRDESPAEAEYRRRAPTVSDTPDAQYALACWCRDNGLKEATRTHLARVLEFDPQHAEARLLLGYQQVGGEWMTREDVLASRGLVRWRGEYRTPQEVLLLKQKRQAERSQADWRDRLKRLSVAFASTDDATLRAAEEELLAIDDPMATPVLIRTFNDSDDALLRRRLIVAIGALGTGGGYDALLNIALREPDSELRALATEQLGRVNGPRLVMALIGALRSNENAIVNRAADVLLGLSAQTAVEPLIEALVTTHRRRVGNNSDGTTYSFNAASSQFGFGGDGPRTLEHSAQNPRVLNALVELTGVNFLYDQEGWRSWLRSKSEGEPLDLRRDS